MNSIKSLFVSIILSFSVIAGADVSSVAVSENLVNEESPTCVIDVIYKHMYSFKDKKVEIANADVTLSCGLKSTMKLIASYGGEIDYALKPVTMDFPTQNLSWEQKKEAVQKMKDYIQKMGYETLAIVDYDE